MIDKYQLSERSACKLSGISRAAYRYQAIPSGDIELKKRLVELASKHKDWATLCMQHAQNQGIDC